MNPDDPTNHGPKDVSVSGLGYSLGATALNIGANVYNSYQASQTAKYNTDATNAANRQMAELAYQRDLDMWNRNNQYNSPEAQMARLKAAGLNPNMVYGTGAVGNASGATPRYNAPQVQYNYRPTVNLPEVLGMYQDFQVRQAQIDNLKAQEENTRAKTITEHVRPALVEMQAQSRQWETSKSQDFAKYQGQILASQAEGSKAKMHQEFQRLALMKQQELTNVLNQEYRRKAMTAVDIDNEKRRADLLFMQYRNEWMKMGITSSDNILFRVFVRMMNQSGLTSGDIFK